MPRPPTGLPLPMRMKSRRAEILTIINSTVIGKVHTARLDLASNAIFMARPGAGDAWSHPVISDQNQQGCVRFSFVPLNSIVPRRYRCQPDLAVTAALDGGGRAEGQLEQFQAAGDHRGGASARPARVHDLCATASRVMASLAASAPKKFAPAPRTSRRWARFTTSSRRSGKPI